MTATRVSRAWSCSVRLVVEDDAVLDPAAADLTELLARIGTVASRFDAGTEISHVNARAGTPTTVSPLLADMLRVALDAARRTDGACDPTVGQAVVAAGYDRDIAEVLPAPGPTRTPTPGRWAEIVLDGDRLTVPAGTQLDLGATGKAYAADRAATWIHQRFGTAVLVEIGGDLAVAGHRDGGWTVRVAERENGAAQLVTVHGGGLATSTTTIRRWTGGHHVIDPATGRPVDGPWRTASVSAGSAVLANAASTAALVKARGAEAWLADRGVAARLVARDGTVRTTPGWPALRPAPPVVSFDRPGRQIVLGGAR